MPHEVGSGEMGFYWSVRSAVKVIAVVFVVGFLSGFVGAQYSGPSQAPAHEVADVRLPEAPALLP